MFETYFNELAIVTVALIVLGVGLWILRNKKYQNNPNDPTLHAVTCIHQVKFIVVISAILVLLCGIYMFINTLSADKWFSIGVLAIGILLLVIVLPFETSPPYEYDWSQLLNAVPMILFAALCGYIYKSGALTDNKSRQSVGIAFGFVLLLLGVTAAYRKNKTYNTNVLMLSLVGMAFAATGMAFVFPQMAGNMTTSTKSFATVGGALLAAGWILFAASQAVITTQ